MLVRFLASAAALAVAAQGGDVPMCVSLMARAVDASGPRFPVPLLPRSSAFPASASLSRLW